MSELFLNVLLFSFRRYKNDWKLTWVQSARNWSTSVKKCQKIPTISIYQNVRIFKIWIFMTFVYLLRIIIRRFWILANSISDIFVLSAYHVQTFFESWQIDFLTFSYPSRIFSLFLTFLCGRFYGLFRKIFIIK